MTYTVGDRISHPMHGAGIIDSIETAKLDGVFRDYYVMRISIGDILVKIPKDTSDTIGVRPIIAPSEADAILNSINDLEFTFTANWNKRYRENLDKIKSGNLNEVALVIKSLTSRDNEKGLSTGERKMLHSAKQILLSEIVLSKSADYDEIAEQLEKALA